MGLRLLDHPLAEDALADMRRSATDLAGFRAASDRVALLLAAEALRGAETVVTEVETPLEKAEAKVLSIALFAVPILRAGLALLPAFQTLAPRIIAGSIGLRRSEETGLADVYHHNLPDLTRGTTWVLDPMLATGGSAVQALAACRAAGARRLAMVSVLAAPEGLQAVQEAEPDIDIYCAAIDRELDERRFIRPGLGDYGDRFFGA
jgi:uracil phosphoribosyltransferase